MKTIENKTDILLDKKIYKLRQLRKMSQERLSELTGISAHHIEELEREKSNNPTYQLLSKLADALGVTVLMLLDFEHLKQKTELQQELISIIQVLPEDKLRIVYRLLHSFTE